MNYPEDDYDNIHQTIADELRPEWMVWKIRKEEQTELEKKEICRKKMEKLSKLANK